MPALPDQMKLTPFVPADRPGRAAKTAAAGADAVIADLKDDAVVPDARDAAWSALVPAARLAGQPAPLDGVTTAIRDEALIEDDCRNAVEMGMGGTLIVHPAQLEAARRGLEPSADAVAWANEVQNAAEMIDAPVITRASRTIARTWQAA